MPMCAPRGLGDDTTSSSVRSSCALEPLEPRLLLSASGLDVWSLVAADAPRDATEAFAWSGFRRTGDDRAVATLAYRFDPPGVSSTAAGAWVTMAGLPSLVEPGLPALPVRRSAIALPDGWVVENVQVAYGEIGLRDAGVALSAGPAPVPMSEAAAPVAPTVFSGVIDPGLTWETQRVAGVSAGVFEIAPVGYDAGSGSLSWASEVTVEVSIARDPSRDAGLSRAWTTSEADRRRLVAWVDNDSALPLALASDAPSSSDPPPDADDGEPGTTGGDPPAPAGGTLPQTGSFEWLVVTGEELVDEFQTLVEHKLDAGVSATLVTSEYIDAHSSSSYAGEDDAAGRLREFLTEAYEQWGTRWVLLGGDTDQVAHRSVRVEANGKDVTFASDMYFACLDGPYNGDGDGYWGEPTDGADGGDVDRAPELFVGRAPVSTPSEAAHFVAKTIAHELDPTAGATSTLWIGQKMDSDPLTWGADTMDALREAVFPPDYDHAELYERDGTGEKSEIIAAMNASPAWLNHLGHGSVSGNAKLYASDVRALTNETPFFYYSEACYSGKFDASDAIAETFLSAESAAWATIMNTHYGWYIPGGIGGSYYWHEEFWDAVFNEGLSRVGEAHFDSKADRSSISGTGRWTFFASTLFGDPHARLVMPLPEGPRVIEAAAEGEEDGTYDTVRLTFSEAMDPGSFRLHDDVALIGPGGVDLSESLIGFEWQDAGRLDVHFLPVDVPGGYALTLGPDLADPSGQAMDVDGDGTLGEPDDDVTTTGFAVATRAAAVEIYSADMSADPGWTLEGQWAWGQTEGLEGDPASAHTGESLVGYNLDGQYPATMSGESAILPALDLTGVEGVTLDYWRWLGVEGAQWDQATIEVSTDGGQSWTIAWSNPAQSLVDVQWTRHEVDLTEYVAGEPDVRIRFVMGPTDRYTEFGGWNIDDVTVLGAPLSLEVVDHAPRTTDGPLTSIDVAFNAPVDPATLTADDIVLTGPAGMPIDVLGVTALDAATFRIDVEEASGTGTFELALGPDVTSLAGVALDSDRDGTGGEAEDAYVGLIERTPPDLTPPRVVSMTPSGAVTDPLESLVVSFSEAMAPSSFSLDDVLEFSGPEGDLRSRITGYRWLGPAELSLSIGRRRTPGTYRLRLAPSIVEAGGGQAIDQDGDGLAGETTEDVFVATVLLDDEAPYVTAVEINDGLDLPGRVESVRFAFSEDVSTSIDVGDLWLYNETTQSSAEFSLAAVSWDEQALAARWDLSACDLPPARYLLGLDVASITDQAGRALQEGPDTSRSLLVCPLGDADRNGTVNVTDLAIVASGWGMPGTWDDGDFSGDGAVDVSDLAILAAHWGADVNPAPEPTFAPPGDSDAFALERAGHQLANDLSRIAQVEEDLVNRPGDGHVHAVGAGELHDAAAGRHALDDRYRRLQGPVDALAPADSLAEAAVAAHRREARGHQVAHARQAREGLPAGAQGLSQAGDLHQAARQQRRLGVVPQLQPVQDARGDGDDVLGRSGELHAQRVVVGVDAEVPQREQLLHAPGEGGVLRRGDDRRGLPAGDLGGDARSGQHGQGATALAPVEHVGDDVRRTQQRVVLDALGDRADGQVARTRPGDGAPPAPQVLGGHGRDGQFGVLERLLGEDRDLDLLGDLHAR